MSELQAGTEPTGRQIPTLGGPGSTGKHLADLFSALADQTLLHLLEFVLDHDRSVADCSAHLGIPPGQAVRQLNYLADYGCIEARLVDGQRCYGAVNGQVIELLDLARSMASDRSSALAGCTRISNGADSHSPR